VSRPRWKKRLREREQIYLRQIEDERARSDRLLLNILPHPIATRLKNGEQWIVNSFEEVTVLFPDLVGFTSLTTQTAPSALIQLLDQVFSAFDELADLHGVEKIKTTGDAYMAAAGVPFPHRDHAFAAARMSLGMQSGVSA
jgi:class 3 adenylate cyclase